MVRTLNEEELFILNEALTGSKRLRPSYKYFLVNASSKQGRNMLPFRFHTCFDYADVYAENEEEFNYAVEFISDKEKFINYCKGLVNSGYTMA